MSNVIGVANMPGAPRRVGDMDTGEVGYTVPQAYCTETDHLDENCVLWERGSMACLRVKCVKPGQYSLTFEKPECRPIGDV